MKKAWVIMWNIAPVYWYEPMAMNMNPSCETVE